ncbi:unnamed protein product [Lampetra planeri]
MEVTDEEGRTRRNGRGGTDEEVTNEKATDEFPIGLLVVGGQSLRGNLLPLPPHGAHLLIHPATAAAARQELPLSTIVSTTAPSLTGQLRGDGCGSRGKRRAARNHLAAA